MAVERAVDRTRRPNEEAGDAARQGGGVGRLHDRVNVIALDREVDEAKAFT
jgi:hypothetical protein